jgi:C4-dicarboxylate-specific signal transduction histidine kinase
MRSAKAPSAAFLVAALLQEERQDAGVLLRLEAARIALWHRVSDQLKEITERRPRPSRGELAPGVLADGMARGARPLELLLPAGGLGRCEHPVHDRAGRALTLSLMAMTAAVGAAVFWPQALVNQEILAGGLALIPALLLAHYRGWPIVSALLGVGLVALTIIHLSPVYVDLSIGGPFLILFVVAPYITIALGAGWFGEVRRYQAELRATQLQLIQSEKLDSLGRMAAGVAHEVKNPLMMILTGAKVLSTRLTDADESTRQILHDMTDAVERADRIISGLLSYSRDRGLDLAPADLNGTVERSLLLVNHALDTARIAIVKNLHESLPLVQFDKFKMQQVFVNLFTRR